MVVNIFILSKNDSEKHDVAIRNISIFTVWVFTMFYMVNPNRVPWIIILYSTCILIILMFYTLHNCGLLHSLFTQDETDFNINNQQACNIELILFWFDVVAFFIVIHLLEPRQENNGL